MDVSLKTPLGDYVPWESPENILFTKVIQSLLVKRASGSLRTSVMVFLGRFVLLGDVTQLASYSIGDDRVSKKRDQWQYLILRSKRGTVIITNSRIGVATRRA